MNDFEVKVSRLNGEIESKSLTLREKEKMITEMRLKVDANKALIDGLVSEKNHITLSLNENRDLKE
jgi:hypothetical protein